MVDRLTRPDFDNGMKTHKRSVPSGRYDELTRPDFDNGMKTKSGFFTCEATQLTRPDFDNGMKT